MIRLVLLLPLCTVLASAASEPAAALPPPPRLAVVISIDQCRADYLERFQPYFVEGGFRRLMEQGAHFRSAHHKHAMTATAPGHATILSGVSASEHGIIANEWFDPELGRMAGAVEDAKSPIVGGRPKGAMLPGSADAEISGSPHRLLVATVGDQLKLRYGAASRVIGVANKDRAAIFLAGRLADAAYWLVQGRFVTSRFYRSAVPAWVAQFNATEPVNSTFGATWDRLLAPAIYDAVQGPDDAPGEESRHGLGTTFPRKVDGGQPAIGPAFENAYRLVPHGSVVLGAFAQRTVVEEQLGQDDVPDLLCVGFSQPDYAGHSFGPDSHEIMDSILRLDRVLAELLAFLDGQVGVGHYVVVLTGDHGVAPLPERVQAFNRGLVAGRLDYRALNRSVEEAVTAAFGAPANDASWTLRDGHGFRLVAATLAAGGVTSADAQRVVKAALLRSPQIGLAWTRDELRGAVPALGPFLDDWRLSFNAERSQDVVFSPKPYVVDRSPAGTNHGTPYDYDNNVPMLWYGPGVRAGREARRVGTDSIAPTLSALLGVPPPPLARGPRLF